MSKIYFISDMHFYHENIIKFCDRPFKGIDEMNEEIVKRWNNTIAKNDKVFVLGDLGLTTKENIKNIIGRLHGNKTLIRGNHDKFTDEFYRSIGFKEVCNYPIIYKKFFVLSHEPVKFVNGTSFLNIHGHIHNNEYDTENNNENHFNVSVEVIGYKPIDFQEIKNIRGFD